MTATLTAIAFQADVKPFASAVSWAVAGVPARPQIPTLGGVLLKVADGTLTLSGFDYDVATTASLEVEGASDGAALVSGRLLGKLVETLPNKPVEVRADGSELVLTCGTVVVTMPTMPVEDYPGLPEVPGPVGSVNAEVFARSVKRVAVAAGHDETVPMLTGILLAYGETLQLVASNRYAFAYDRLDWTSGGAEGEAAIPADVLAKVVTSLATSAEPVTVGVGEGVVSLSTAGRTLVARQVAERLPLPAVLNFIAAKGDRIAALDAAEILDAVKRGALVHEKLTPVELAFSEGEVRVSAAGEARAATVVPCRYEGREETVRVNPDYMRNAISGAGPEAVMSWSDPKRAFVVRPADEADPFRYVVMPVR